jgi:RecJ-like exonuclease
MSSENVNRRSKNPCPQCDGTGRDERGRNCPMCDGHAFALVSRELCWKGNGYAYKHPRDVPPDMRGIHGGVSMLCWLGSRYWEEDR